MGRLWAELEPDSVKARQMLISMLDGFDRTRRLLGAAMFTPEQENARVTRIVDCFLHAYAP